MNRMRAWIAVAVVAMGVSSAQALGKLGFLNLFQDQLTQSKATLADPNQAANIDAALAVLVTAPGVGEYDNLKPDLLVASKAVAALGPAAADTNVTNAINTFLPGAHANVVGRGAQANAVATSKLSPLKLFGFIKKVTGIKSALDKASNNPKFTPSKKLKKFAGFAGKYDALYNKYK